MPSYQTESMEVPVTAFKIKAVTPGSQSWRIDFDADKEPIEANLEWVAANAPQAGGYFVIFADGDERYVSAPVLERLFTAV